MVVFALRLRKSEDVRRVEQRGDSRFLANIELLLQQPDNTSLHRYICVRAIL